MSKRFSQLKKAFILLGLASAIIIISQSTLLAQDIETKLKIIAPNQLMVEGKFLSEKFSTKDWSFLKSYADANNLAERIEYLKLFDEKGREIQIKKLISGEYLASQSPKTWQYQVNLTPSSKITDSAHASWLAENSGLLMLDDLLPQFKSTGQNLTIQLPSDWRIFTTEKKKSENTFAIKNYQKAVFLVGKNLREKSLQFDRSAVSLLLSGDWQFSDDEALEMVKSILTEYKMTFGEIPPQKMQIILLPFPQENSNSERWRAETRGSTVTIISGALPFKSQAIQRLHEQLRHELFHLWLPNGVNLSGNYDWFYEGFAIYQALRTGVELNQIRFEDFLNTLGRAYDLTQIVNQTQTNSLIEASKNRWDADSNFLYAKGMVVAFLCDLTLLRETKGKQNLKKVFRKIFEKYRNVSADLSSKAVESSEGNEAILAILKSYPELNFVVNNYIKGSKIIDWKSDLATAGIIVEQQGFRVKLKILDKLDGRQKDLLDKLGYNQWRKILQKTK